MESITNPTTTLTLETYNEMCEQLVKQHKELRKTKYALWIARAEWAAAEWNQAMNGIGKYEPEQLKRIELLCRKRANELRQQAA